MQQPVTEKVHLGQTVNPADNTKSMQSIDYSNDFKDVDKKKMNKLTKLFKTGVVDAIFDRNASSQVSRNYLHCKNKEGAC